MKETNTKDDAETNSHSIEVKEALWVASMAGIGILFLILLNKSGRIMVNYSESGISVIPLSFWIVATAILCLCASIFILLKDSKSVELKVVGITLTGILPIVATLMIVVNVMKL